MLGAPPPDPRSALKGPRPQTPDGLSYAGLRWKGAEVERNWLPAGVRARCADGVEEYARHNGHADILRESIDGVTGA
ncbi:DUF664 domain-containing protein [Streptomyces sp. NBC_01518]